MRQKIERLARYIVTPETAQYRVFSWLRYPTLPDKNLIVIAREDDLMFGLLQSRFHELWSLRKGSDLQDRPRYTHTSTFATFPFPDGMSPDGKRPVETVVGNGQFRDAGGGTGMTDWGWEADIAQCDTALEKPFMITTPTTMKPMPIMAAESSFWPWISHATAATNTTPKPAQIA